MENRVMVSNLVKVSALADINGQLYYGASKPNSCDGKNACAECASIGKRFLEAIMERGDLVAARTIAKEMLGAVAKYSNKEVQISELLYEYIVPQDFKALYGALLQLGKLKFDDARMIAELRDKFRIKEWWSLDGTSSWKKGISAVNPVTNEWVYKLNVNDIATLLRSVGKYFNVEYDTWVLGTDDTGAVVRTVRTYIGGFDQTLVATDPTPKVTKEACLSLQSRIDELTDDEVASVCELMSAAQAEWINSLPQNNEIDEHGRATAAGHLLGNDVQREDDWDKIRANGWSCVIRQPIDPQKIGRKIVKEVYELTHGVVSRMTQEELEISKRHQSERFGRCGNGCVPRAGYREFAMLEADYEIGKILKGMPIVDAVDALKGIGELDTDYEDAPVSEYTAGLAAYLYQQVMLAVQAGWEEDGVTGKEVIAKYASTLDISKCRIIDGNLQKFRQWLIAIETETFGNEDSIGF